MKLNKKFSPIVHPPLYLKKQISPPTRRNNMNAEIVWTYLIARQYEKDLGALVRLLCGREENMPTDAKIWLEAYLYPPRIPKEEGKYWKTRADLATGCIEHVGYWDLGLMEKLNFVLTNQKKCPPFDEEEKRREFAHRLNAIPEPNLPKSLTLTGIPKALIMALKKEDSLMRFVQELEWCTEQIRNGKI